MYAIIIQAKSAQIDGDTRRSGGSCHDHRSSGFSPAVRATQGTRTGDTDHLLPMRHLCRARPGGKHPAGAWPLHPATRSSEILLEGVQSISRIPKTLILPAASTRFHNAQPSSSDSPNERTQPGASGAHWRGIVVQFAVPPTGGQASGFLARPLPLDTTPQKTVSVTNLT